MKLCQCGKPRKSGRLYCSRQCSVELKRAVYIESWKRGEELGGSDIGVSEIVRHFLMERSGGQCESDTCGWDWSKPSGVEVEHINGNPLDHSLGNLMVICPNCHTQTATFKGRNRGSGRAWRRAKHLRSSSKADMAYEPATCLDCDTSIYYGSKRCHACAAKARTYKTVIDWPSDDSLLNLIAETNNAQVARDLGVSYNAVKKRAQRILSSQQ
jgi:hypothetical protein